MACVKACLPFRSHISSSGSFSTQSQLRLLGLGDRAGGRERGWGGAAVGGTWHRRSLGKAGGREAQSTLPTRLSASPLGEEGSSSAWWAAMKVWPVVAS